MIRYRFMSHLRIVTLMLLCQCGPSVAAPPVWRNAPAHVRIEGGVVVASSGGAPTGDEYLLTRDAYRDYVLTFEARRLPFEGPQPRAILVVHIDPANPVNRTCIFFGHLITGTNEADRFRLVAVGDRVRLYRNGNLCANSVVPYGNPPDEGPIGFLHYYDYGYRYENLDVVPLDAKALPAPTQLTATVRPSGVVSLRWTVPPDLAEVLSFDVHRSLGGECQATQENRVSTANFTEFADRAVRTNASYTYRVAARVEGREAGPASKPATIQVTRSKPPLPPVHARAVRRIDGSVRLAWELPPEGRAASVRLLAYKTPITAQSLRRASVIADSLSLSRTSFLAPSGSPTYFAVVVQDPDGKQPAWVPVEARPAAPEVKPGMGWPTRHPMLMYDWEQVVAARRMIANDEGARRTFDQLRRSADALIRTPPEAPKEPTDDHPLIGKLVTVGQAFVLSGEDKYAKWVRDVMMSYATVYPTWPVTGSGRARMVKTASGLYEAIRYVPIVCAYDLTFDSPVYSAEDRVTIERNFLRPATDLFWVKDYASKTDHRPGDLHYKCYNFQAWFDSCIGLTGLLLRDADMVEHAIDGPFAFKHLLAHDIHDDGVFWERSLGYHNFVVQALYPFLEAAHHCNLDLWHLTVPDDYNADREPLANYCVGDGDNGPKSIKLMFDSQFFVTYGDLTYAQIADSDRGPLTPSDYYRTAWVRYHDPKVAWLINKRRDRRPLAQLHRGNADASAEVALAFDQNNLYLAAKVTDDVVTNTHREPSEVWAGDALWFGLKWRNEEGGPYDFIYGLSPGDFKDTPPVPALFNRFSAPHNGPGACRYGVKRVEGGYTIEAAFPLTEFVPLAGETGTAFQPKNGDKAIVDFVIYDCDAVTGSSTKEKMVGWCCTTDRYDSAQGGTVIFGPGKAEARVILGSLADPPPTIDGDVTDWPSVKTGGWQPLQPVWAQIRRGAAVMTDASSAGPDLHALFYPQPKPTEGQFDLRGRSFCNNGVLQAGCSLFPSTGFAVLRERLDDEGHVPPDATCATLNFGPYGGGHGHPDRLSLVLYADGKHWIPDFGSCGYDSTEKGTWTAQTVSHNTVVVDGVSQYPTGEANPTWPCDSADKQARALLGFFCCDDVMKSASAHCNSVYEGVHLARTICMVGDVLLDFYEAKSPAQHQYDYVLHVDGPLIESSAALTPVEGALGQKCGYQHIDRLREGRADGAVVTDWGGADQRGPSAARKLRLTARGVKGATVIVGEGITTNLTAKTPLLVLRRRGKEALFAVAMQPFTEAPPAKVQWLGTASDQVAAATTTVGDTQVLVVFNGTGKPVTVNGLRVRGTLAVRRTKDGRITKAVEAG